MNRSICMWSLAAAVVVLAGGAALAAETPGLTIELAGNGPNEQRAKEQLERLTKEHDLARWIFTKKIRIDQRARPHSHPVLTLNTRYAMNDRLALAGFVHEQIHWFLTKKERDTDKAIGDVMRLYPDAPDNVAAGGASGRPSTYLHLIVCQLEFESVRALLGVAQATAVLREQIAEGASAGLGYNWIYQKVLDDQEPLSRIIRERKLTLPGV